MTDKEIIKALECCGTATCISNSCPYEKIHDIPTCTTKLTRDALDLINRQQAVIEHLQGEREVFLEDIHHSADQINEQIEEIERLNIRLRKERHQFADLSKMYSEIRAEAIKEFAEKLKDDSWFTDLYDRDDYPVRAVTIEDIDNLVKEMVGEDK